jgi:hypothetical protein
MKVSIFFGIVFSLFVCSSCTTFNDIKEIKPSPDGKFAAIAFIRNGGATTGYSPQISILKNNEKLGNKTGNIFIGAKSRYISVYWKNNSTLVVQYNSPEDYIYKRVDKFHSIKIKYIRIP